MSNGWRSRLRALWKENRTEGRVLLTISAVFLAIYFMPVGTMRFDNALLEGVYLVHWYAQEHVILCLLPAFLIAGAMAVYLSQGAVMRFLGPSAPKPVALGVASVSGILLAVCSCTVLPLFGGIYRRGAGLGPAMAFLYSGPAINILAIVITAKVLGAELGLARAIGAIVFAIVIGVIMHLLYRREEASRAASQPNRAFDSNDNDRPLADTVIFFTLMVGMLVFANWAAADSGVWHLIYTWKWPLTALLGGGFALLLVSRWGWSVGRVLALAVTVAVLALLFPRTPQLAFAVAVVGIATLAALQPGAGQEWFSQSWDFTKQILPLLLIGVLVAGFLLGRPGYEGIIPSPWVDAAVGGNSLLANLLASVLGAFMYFATLTEVPIVQGLLGAGMGKGPALALLLAGPALSLPNMLVIRSIIGTEKTVVYCALVVVMATFSGFIYGAFGS
ncbi:MAG: permease [Gammaproteobacteria bacterium]